MYLEQTQEVGFCEFISWKIRVKFDFVDRLATFKIVRKSIVGVGGTGTGLAGCYA